MLSETVNRRRVYRIKAGERRSDKKTLSPQASVTRVTAL